MSTIDKVIDGLYVGNGAVSSDIDALHRHKITHIVVAGFGLKQHFPDSFKYKKIDMIDTPSYEIHRHFAECNSFIDSALSHGGSVLVHCFQGISRSTTIVCAYLMHKQHMTAVHALQFVKERHRATDPNFGFVYQLNQYEEVLKSGVLLLSVPQVGPEDKAYCRCALL
jgi:protein-tyrosine phosphatase